jgi:hypothetical protein
MPTLREVDLRDCPRVTSDGVADLAATGVQVIT